MRWERFRLNVNTDSGKVNTDSGKSIQVFTFGRNSRSRSTGLGVHVHPESVFTMDRNMHTVDTRVLEFFEPDHETG